MQNSLHPVQKQAMRRVMAAVDANSDSVGLLFYARLFEINPALRALFKTDLEDQGHTVMTMLHLCVQGLDEHAELEHALRNLGARHVEYGVKTEHYAQVKQALLHALESGCGAEWDAETAAGVNAVLDWFMGIMQENAGA